MSFTLSGLKGAYSLFSPSGNKARLSILIYHRVLAKPDPLSDSDPLLAEFEMHMALLARQCNVLPLHEAVIRLQQGSLPARAAAITFDDGFADNLHVALPVLKKHGLHATFFISTGYLGGGVMFNDLFVAALRETKKDELDLSFLDLGKVPVANMEQRKQAFYLLLNRLRYRPVAERLALAHQVADEAEVMAPTDLMLDESGVRALHAAGMELGGHTVNHPILALLDDASAHHEIAEGKDQLESIIGEPIRLFAYPNGRPGTDYLPRDMAAVKKLGFTAAVSTQMGAAGRATVVKDLYQLPRFTPWDKTPARFAARMMLNLKKGYSV